MLQEEKNYANSVKIYAKRRINKLILNPKSILKRRKTHCKLFKLNLKVITKNDHAKNVMKCM